MENLCSVCGKEPKTYNSGKCKDCYNEAKRERYKTDNEYRSGVLKKRREYRLSGKKKIVDKKSHLKMKYGLTEAEVSEMFAAQNFACAVCFEQIEKPHIDHCHTTGKVRGLLCGRCNRALGLFRENPTIVQAAVDYLKKQ